MSSTQNFVKRRQHAAAAKLVITSEDRKSFMNMFPFVVQDLKSYAATLNSYPAPDWYERSLKYNVSHGKNNRGLLAVMAFKELATNAQKTPENLRRVQLLGWCLELLTGSILVLDDLIDNSQTRRKQPCWYKLDGVGFQAINDSLMIENGLYHLLDKYFSDTDCYIRLMDLFREANFITNVGQVLDFQGSQQNVTEYTMAQYKALCRNKTCFTSISLPVFLIMHICGIPDEQALIETDKVFTEIGVVFQAQNDFEDCYLDAKATGRVGTDIEDNRLTWLATRAVSEANDRQLKILRECYGQRDPEKVAAVRRVYDELNMRKLFAEFFEDRYNYINNPKNTKATTLKHELFLQIWDLFLWKAKIDTTN